MQSVNLGGTDATYATIGALNLNKQVNTLIVVSRTPQALPVTVNSKGCCRQK